MAAARYWRFVAVDTYAGGDLELSEVALYEGATRVDASATLTSVFAPAAGSLSSLQDGSFSTSARWSAADVRAPGFALVWDFGAGVTKDITKIGVAGPSRDACILRVTIEYSSDGLQWSTLGAASVKHVDAGALATFGNFDQYSAAVCLLAYADSAIGDASFSVNDIKLAGPAGGIAPSSAVTIFSQKTIELSGGWGLASDRGAYNFQSGDFTIEAFVRPAGSGEMGVIAKRPSFALYSPISVYVRDNRLFVLGSYAGGAWDINAGFASGSIDVPSGSFTHIAVARQGGVIRTFVGGAPDQSFTVGSSNIFTNDSRISIGASSEDGASPFSGHIYGLRVTRGVARYTSAFTPPASPMIEIESIVSAPIRTPVSSTSLIGSDVTGFTQAVISAQLPQLDIYDAGRGRVIGTVKEKSTPTNVPLKRRVVLLSMPGSRAIRETWSDPASGVYEFREIAMDRRYTVISYDHTGVYRGVVADNLSPELMT